MMKTTSIDADKLEFEDADVPLELKDDVEDAKVSAEGKLKAVFNDEQRATKERKAKMKKNPKPLKLSLKPKTFHHFKTKDYIVFRCNLCEKEMNHAKKDDDGNFEPYALCQHVVFKGLYAEN